MTTPTKYTSFYDLVDIEEFKKTNVLVSGCNCSGKSLVAMGLCSVLGNVGFNCLVIDTSGIWKKQSDISEFIELEANKPVYRLPAFKQSLIVDTSSLTIDDQKLFVDALCCDLWLNREAYGNGWLWLVIEEFEVFGRFSTQNLYRLMHTGRNKQIRCCAISTDLALIPASYVRLTSFRLHSKINREENCRRKFRNYYGQNWLSVAENLKVGQFIRLNKSKLSLVSIPLFIAKRTPQPQQQTKTNFLKRFIDFTQKAWNEA